jgi:adenylate kinase family enzyme
MAAPHRIWVLGTSGSGKTELAKRLAKALGVPHVELDAIMHQPGWVEASPEEFRQSVLDATAADGWVVDGNYAAAREVAFDRATCVVWLDFPRPLVMRRVVWRSTSRWLTRRELWNGNRERARDWLSPEHPIRWAWSTHVDRSRRYADALDVRWVRLRSPAEAAAWLESFGGVHTGDG